MKYYLGLVINISLVTTESTVMSCERKLNNTELYTRSRFVPCKGQTPREQFPGNFPVTSR